MVFSPGDPRGQEGSPYHDLIKRFKEKHGRGPKDADEIERFRIDEEFQERERKNAADIVEDHLLAREATEKDAKAQKELHDRQEFVARKDLDWDGANAERLRETGRLRQEALLKQGREQRRYAEQDLGNKVRYNQATLDRVKAITAANKKERDRAALQGLQRQGQELAARRSEADQTLAFQERIYNEAARARAKAERTAERSRRSQIFSSLGFESTTASPRIGSPLEPLLTETATKRRSRRLRAILPV